MTAHNIPGEISRAAAAVNCRRRTLVRAGVLDGSRVCVFPKGSICVGGGTGSFGGNEYSQNQESENGDQHHVPAPEPRGGAGRGPSQTALKRAIIAPVNSEFRFVRPGLHKSSSAVAIPASD